MLNQILRQLPQSPRCRHRRQHRSVLAAGLLALGLLLMSLRWFLRQPQYTAEELPLQAEESLVALGKEPQPALSGEVAVVVLTSRRPEVQVLLRQLIASRPAGFRILVSQDGTEPDTARTLRQFGSAVTRLRFSIGARAVDSYARISRHHLRLLDRVFLDLGFQHVIVMEDDLLIAPDFYKYFGTLRTALDRDSSIFCVSAWNDNGLGGLVNNDATLLHRTDFFPGLGWMIAKSGWLKVRSHWPDSQFDDFLRKFMLKEGLVCVRPEISRTFNTGRCGGRELGTFDTYGSTFYQKYLSRVVLNQQNISIPVSSISRILGRANDRELERRARDIPLMKLTSLLSALSPPAVVRLQYRSVQDFLELALQIGIIPEIWFGAPRASILGIVVLSIRESRVFIVPDGHRLPLSDDIVTAPDNQKQLILLNIWGVTLLALGCLLALANLLIR